ncbi:putative acyl-CoA-binding protein [Eurytemora carolleeae]|uniref:putative acyl-CoA-binding protein n=1 Tax=Eurytemora carolleeae TaxID=1294199 RepID=UPI000C78787A|nr:putative acyl-CoA-binding protein [Eurytemora carolleeae]|eukprot:XP_023326997.1 putative acyl-CoA-binding protein [Eurytemora affinis]
MGLNEDFEAAVDSISNKVNKTMSDDELKEIYSLYKQATVGDVNTDRPGMLDFKGKAKWDAWSGKKGISQDDAKQKYVEFAAQMLEKHGARA